MECPAEAPRFRVPLVAKLHLGTPVLETPFRVSAGPRSVPISNHLDQPRHSGIIASAGIAPVDGVIDMAALHRDLMQVFQLRQPHLVALGSAWAGCLPARPGSRSRSGAAAS